METKEKETTPGVEDREWPECSECAILRKAARDIKVLRMQKAMVLAITDIILIVAELWSLQALKVSSSGRSKENLYKKLGKREEQIRALFHDLIEAREFSFLYGLIRVLHDPKLIQ